MKKLKEIKKMPTVHDNVHESIYKSHATLQIVKDMLKRGDSNESILIVIEDVYEISDNNQSLSLVLDSRDKSEQKHLRSQALRKADELLKEIKDNFR